MAREAALSARLKLDDSDVQKKIKAQNAHYQSLISQNKRYKDRIAADNETARKKEEVREQLAIRKQMSREREKFEKWKQQNAAATAEKIKRWKKEQELEVALQSHPAAQRMAGNRAMNVPMSSGGRRGGGGGRRGGGGGGGGDTVQGGATNAGMAMLMFSQGLEDAQYGLRGVMNNIPPLVMALGGGPGLAGVISVAAVAVSSLAKIWEKLNGQQEQAERNAKSLTAWTERTTKAVQAAEAAGQSQAEAYQQQFDLMDQKREYDQQELSRQERLAAAQRDVQQAELERLNGAARLQAEHELNSKAERERVEAEQAAAQRQAQVDSEKLAEIRTQQQNAMAILKEYEAMKAAAEKAAATENNQRDNEAANRMRRRRESLFGLINEGAATIVDKDLEKALRDSMGNASAEWSPKDEAAMAKLRGFTEANAPNIDTAASRARASTARAADVDVDRKALDLSDKAEQIRIANAAAEEFNETLKKNFEQGRQFGEMVGGVFRTLSNNFSEILKKTREQAQARGAFEGNLEVQELRAKGRHRAADRLEKKLFLGSRPKQLEKEFGMGAAQAAEVAQREWDAQHPVPGKIKGATAPQQGTGFDWFTGGSSRPSEYDKLQNSPRPAYWSERQTAKEAKVAEAAANPSNQGWEEVGRGLRNIYEVLQNKLGAPNGTVGNQLKPANR
jgi:chemotaxis protein histidine kinase CheA